MTKETKELPLKDLPEGIYFKCTGSYYARYKNASGVENYETYLQFSKTNIDVESKGDKLLSIVQNQLINHHLKDNVDKFPYFYSCRECKIEEVVYNFKSLNTVKAVSKPSKIGTMTIEELKLFVFEQGLFTKVDKFSTIFKAREAVRNDYENKKIEDKFAEERKKKEKNKFKPK